MTRADRILLVSLICLVVLAVPLAAWASGDGAVELRGPGGSTRVDLARDGVYRVQGRLGEVVFEVRDHEVYCVSSGCPDQVCVQAGRVQTGSPVVCAPNGVVALSCAAAAGGELDAVSR